MILDASARMDRMYRHQRHIYDLSRKFYLLGRDRLITGLALRPGDAICEIGCGTGRNLVALARRYPGVEIYGIDASEEMLKTARATIARRGLQNRVRLRRGLAETLDPEASFGLDRRFDAVVFSYALSMIPRWERAIDRAIDALRPGGTLAVVDFSEQRQLPPWFRGLLRRWLALFEVHPNPAISGYLATLAARAGADFAAEPIYRDYACLLRYRKSEA
jgi:S-adenosylmethionine-diacylgycerolhomoserine-N-methlytransferase